MPRTCCAGSAPSGQPFNEASGSGLNLLEGVSALQRVALEEAMKRTGGNAAQAARLLLDLGSREQLWGRETDDLEKEFAARTGWPLTAVDWTAAERRRIEELVRIKYGQVAWNKKR